MNTIDGLQVDITYQCCIDSKALFETNNYELGSVMDLCSGTREDEIMNSNTNPYWNEERTVCTHDTAEFPCSAVCQNTCRRLGGNVIESDTHMQSTTENNVDYIIQNNFDCVPSSCDFSSYYQAYQDLMAKEGFTSRMIHPTVNGKSPDTYYGLQFECQPGNNKLNGEQVDFSYECCRDTKRIVERNNHEYNQALHECGVHFQEEWDGGKQHCQSSKKGQGGNQNMGQGNQGQGKQSCRFDYGQLACFNTCKDICDRWDDTDAIEYDETVDCENFTFSQTNRFSCVAQSCDLYNDVIKARRSIWEKAVDNCKYEMTNAKINGVHTTTEAPSSALRPSTSQVLHVVGSSFVIYFAVTNNLV